MSKENTRIWSKINSRTQTTSESNWSKVLLAFYRQPDGRITQFNQVHYVPENHILCDETGLSNDKIQNSLKYLKEDVELIDTDSNTTDEDPEYVLTKDGFSVAHQLVKDNRRDLQNAMLVGFTLVLAISAVLQALTSISEFSGAISTALYGALILITIGIALLVWVAPQAFNNTIS